VEPGETLADAAIRETKEEIGIEVHRDALHPGGEIKYDTEGRKITKVVHWFLADVSALDLPDVLPTEWLQANEVDWAGFLGREEAGAPRAPAVRAPPVADHRAVARHSPGRDARVAA
jgi:8-oxo-dGTP pyrophosphatase MutT (NUDIX family)